MIGNYGCIVDGDVFEKFFVDFFFIQVDFMIYILLVLVVGEDVDIEVIIEQIVDFFDSYFRYDGGKGD